MSAVTVAKLNHSGRHVFSYEGRVLARGETWVQLESFFAFEEGIAGQNGEVVFRRGDRFVEWHYSDRWYNIFEVHAVGDDHLKGWYCNITRPAVLTAASVSAEDLALDLWVEPDGRQLLLDEEEFAALSLDAAEHAATLEALDTLRRMVENCTPPFDAIR